MTAIGYTVLVSESIKLIYNNGNEWIAYLISNEKGGYNQFNLQNEWIGYWLSNNKGMFNIFNLNNEWTAFTT